MARWRFVRTIFSAREVEEERTMLRDRSGTWVRDGSTTNEVHRNINGGRIMPEGGEQERSEYFRCKVPACHASTKLVTRFKTCKADDSETFIRGWRFYSTAGHQYHEPMNPQQMIAFDAGM
uniref:Uncharacterized protein n=2 Tax=Meloidogyne TaxID=189290 RepID=A0A6V7US57_MELEN|nr:unnamed protein product [Meloidogyne enterolobii]